MDDDELINVKKRRKSRISNNKTALRLRCSVQNYDWGVLGNHSHVATLSALNSGSAIDSDKPYAEIWIGTHESGPSFVDCCSLSGDELDSEMVTLKDWISEDLSVLGDKVADKWGGDLPFLFKVLAIGKAVSIQVHPDKDFARVLHKLQPSVYKDDNHKPEMALALTEFEALCGFISVKELKDILGSVPEIVEFVGITEAEQILHIIEQDENGKVKEVLESIFNKLMLLDKDTITEMIYKIKRRLNTEKKKRQLTVKEHVVLRLESQYPADVGIIAAFFLNYVKLNGGEALFVGPNEPHAYLSGECIECMATSDNVVRAGLTPKHRDVRTLLSMLKYRQGFPEILRGVPLNQYTKKYLPPCDEFEVDRCLLPQAASAVFPSVPGPSLFLFISGKGKFDTGSSEDAIVEGGEILFVPASMKVSITAESTELHLYRAGVNSRLFRDL
ncbi:mannose-6-phosphate isomerase 2 [Ziziphus jujuba]|uniref:mannose-6-phosphate isomerase n=1 Tax=Ziziphus jujuba TaxID=326968 RepID=A0A6P3ZUS2_ZIZJJ|nr:mannose-6-phosphate isomerase 2 [Ziziphus jujuba]